MYAEQQNKTNYKMKFFNVLVFELKKIKIIFSEVNFI